MFYSIYFYILFSCIYLFLPYTSAIKDIMNNITISYAMADRLILLQFKFIILHQLYVLILSAFVSAVYDVV